MMAETRPEALDLERHLEQVRPKKTRIISELRQLEMFGLLLDDLLDNQYAETTQHWGAPMTPQSFLTLVRWQGL